MRPIRLFGLLLLLPALVALPHHLALADSTEVLNAVGGASTRIDGKANADAKIFVNPEKTVILSCPPGGYVYRVYRKEKKVVALRRPTVMVMADRCRAMDGAAEEPVSGHLYAESDAGITFNDVEGRKILLVLPPGTLR